jgi:hypothetical protein
MTGFSLEMMRMDRPLRWRRFRIPKVFPFPLHSFGAQSTRRIPPSLLKDTFRMRSKVHRYPWTLGIITATAYTNNSSGSCAYTRSPEGTVGGARRLGDGREEMKDDDSEVFMVC